jgi:transposase
LRHASDSFSYSWFCERYKEWASRLKLSLRQVHIAGDKLFVDYSGHTMDVIDALTGEVPAGLDRLARSRICLFRWRGATDDQR